MKNNFKILFYTFIAMAIHFLPACENNAVKNNSQIDTILADTAITDNTSKMQSENENNTATALPDLLLLKEKFAYQHKTEFTSQGIDLSLLKDADENTISAIWPKDRPGFNTCKYFSWQSRDADFYEITLFAEDNIGNNIYYLIFDKNKNYISNFKAAFVCGESVWRQTATGKFISANVFEQYVVYIEDSEDGKTFSGDSTVNHFIIDKQGFVSEKKISEKRFSGKR